MRKRIRRMMGNQSGATAIEYAVIAAFIGIAAIVGITTLGHNLNTEISNVANQVP